MSGFALIKEKIYFQSYNKEICQNWVEIGSPRLVPLSNLKCGTVHDSRFFIKGTLMQI